MALAQWLPRSNRQQGNYTTQSFTIPANVDTVYLQLDVDPVDFSTSDRSMLMAIETSNDSQTWKLQMSIVFVGRTPPPDYRGRIGWFAAVSGLDHYTGQLVRVNFTTVGQFRWGLLGEIL